MLLLLFFFSVNIPPRQLVNNYRHVIITQKIIYRKLFGVNKEHFREGENK